MSASNEYTEWHLTTQGWERGSERVDFGNTTKREPPSERLLTVKYWEYMSSGFSKLDKGQTELFRCGDEEKVASMLQLYGEPPKHL